jgi:hypothetical protein
MSNVERMPNDEARTYLPRTLAFSDPGSVGFVTISQPRSATPLRNALAAATPLPGMKRNPSPAIGLRRNGVAQTCAFRNGVSERGGQSSACPRLTPPCVRPATRVKPFVIRASSFFRHSSFGIRHFFPPFGFGVGNARASDGILKIKNGVSARFWPLFIFGER